MRGNPADGEAHYSYKPALFGAPWTFRLGADALEWQAGVRSGRVPYGQIVRVRLSFRPVSMQSRRYIAEIWPLRGAKLQIISTSWRSMMEQERLDSSYVGFLAALHARMGATGGSARFETGLPPLIYWLGLAAVAFVSLSLAALLVRALQGSQWSGAAFVAGFLAIFLWQAGTFLRRNRPGLYRPDAIPQEVLPIRA
jgi:hypothetical protein